MSFASTEALVIVTLPDILGIAGRGLEEVIINKDLGDNDFLTVTDFHVGEDLITGLDSNKN